MALFSFDIFVKFTLNNFKNVPLLTIGFLYFLEFSQVFRFLRFFTLFHENLQLFLFFMIFLKNY